MNQSHARLQDEAQVVPLKSTAPSLTSAAKARTLSCDSPDSYHQQRHQFLKQSIPTRISHQISNPRRKTRKPHHGLVNIPPAPPRYSRSPQRPRPGPHRMPLFPLPHPIDPLFLSFPFLPVPISVYFRCDTAIDQKQMKGLDQFKHVSMQSLPIGLRGAVQAGWYEGSVFFAIMGELSFFFLSPGGLWG
jgi:hypothetical protein